MNIKYKTVLIILLIVILFAIVIWQAITCRKSSCGVVDINEFSTQSESKDIARAWILTNSSTYKFDGYDLNFKSVKLMRCPSCYQFTYSFKSKYVGYGDRTDQELVEKVSLRNLVINLSNGQIIEAITDGKYDEMKQQSLVAGATSTIPIPSQVPVEPVQIANPASTYCVQKAGSLEIRDFVDGQKGFCIFEDNSECEEWKFFRQECKMGEKLCRDFCGDGACQELVCMAIGCPCAENENNCLIDCTE
jgi:putative hemolysin